jgi:hypothetical protein
MQCFVFDGLGDGLGSADEDGSGLEDDPVGVLVPAVGVAPVGRGLAVRLGAGSGCLWATTRARPGPEVCGLRASLVPPRTCGVLLGVTGVMTVRTGAECDG